MLGASAVYNGTPLSNSIPGQLEEILRANGRPDARVYNCGVVSFVSGQELALVVHTLVDYQPDAVIVYDGGNDVHQTWNFDPRPGYPFNFMVYEEAIRRIHGDTGVFSLLYSVLYQSRVLKRLAHDPLRSVLVPVNELRAQVDYGSESWEEEVVDAYSANIEKMCRLATAYDFKLLVCLQPLLHFKTPLAGNEPSLIGKQKFQDYIRRQYARIRERYDALTLAHSAHGRCFFADMSTVFEGYGRQCYIDFIHPDDEGNRFIAARLAQVVADTICSPGKL